MKAAPKNATPRTADDDMLPLALAVVAALAALAAAGVFCLRRQRTGE